MKSKVTILGLFVAGIAVGVLLTKDDIGVLPSAHAQGAKAADPPERSPVGVVPNRDTYFPGTEPLDPDEMNDVALSSEYASIRDELKAELRAIVDPELVDRCAVENQQRTGNRRFEVPLLYRSE